jgi:quercetin dioxygenase-like cupin family protein
VIRAIPGKTVVPQWHTHGVGFQMFYVLKGWVEFEYKDIGKVQMNVSDAVYQPAGVPHLELAHSDDLEVLEIVSPAKFSMDRANVL